MLSTDMDQNQKREFYDLISTCQFHICSAYCTKDGTKSCKSSFPFQANEESTLKSFLDANGDEHFRVHLRRNNTRINPFSLPIINIWRANMDLQLICGSCFAPLMYVAYYTSKKDKMADIKGVMNKLWYANCDSTHKDLLQRALLAFESYSPVGAPEASANLLQYPHHQQTWDVIRIDTRCCHERCKKQNDGAESAVGYSTEIDSILQKTASKDDRFKLFVLQAQNNNDAEDNKDIQRAAPNVHIQKRIADYFDRPETLNDLTLTAFVEGYETTRRKTKQYKAEGINNRGYVTKRRSNKKITLPDLKFYSSPATRLNARWCLDAIILHVPHRSISDLVVQDCDYAECAIHFQNFIEQRNAEGKPMYAELVKYGNTMIDLDLSTKRIHLQTPCPQRAHLLLSHPRNRIVQLV